MVTCDETVVSRPLQASLLVKRCPSRETSNSQAYGASLTGCDEAPKVVFKTGSIYSTCDSLIVTGSLNGRGCDITIDTGSNISIVRADVLANAERQCIQPVRSCLQTVTGKKAPIHGEGDVHLEVGNLIMTHQMWVTDIQDECLLGLDFLERHNCLVNLKDHCLRIGSQEIPLKKSKGETPPSCCRAVLNKDVSIPPLSETIIPVRINGASTDSEWGIMESMRPTEIHVDGVLVTRTHSLT